MKKQGPILLLTALAVVVGVAVFRNLLEGRRYAVSMLTYSVARDLTNTANSSLLVSTSPDFREELSSLLASPTHIENVRLGDEPPPVGDGRASSRLMLTNELGQGLGIRLRMRPQSKTELRFEVLGYWTNREPGRR